MCMDTKITIAHHSAMMISHTLPSLVPARPDRESGESLLVRYSRFIVYIKPYTPHSYMYSLAGHAMLHE